MSEDVLCVCVCVCTLGGAHWAEDAWKSEAGAVRETSEGVRWELSGVGAAFRESPAC